MGSNELEFQQSSPIEIQGTNGIILRQLFIEDAQNYLDLLDYDRDHVSKYNDDMAEKYKTVEEVIASIVRPNNPNRLRFGIWHEGIMVGSINLTPSEDNERQGVVGYWVGGEHVRQGYATHAVEALITYGIDQLGLHHLVATVHKDNEGSRKTLQKNGFRLAEINNANKTLGYEIDIDAEKPRPVRADYQLVITKDKNEEPAEE